MSAGDSSVVSSPRDGQFLPMTAQQTPLYPSNGLKPAGPQSAVRIGLPKVQRDPLPFAMQPKESEAAKQTSEPARTAWLWRGTNLTTLAMGGGMALVLHTGDSLFFAGALPGTIAGSAPHIFPPLCALLLCGFLAVLPQGGGRAGLRFQDTVIVRFMLAAVAFSVAWTSVELVLRAYGLAPETRRALPLEVLFTGVAALFYAMVNGQIEGWLQGDSSTRDVLIVGTDAVARDVREHLESLPGAGFRFRGFIRLGERELWGHEVAGVVEDLAELARSMFVDEVIVAAQPSMEAMERLCEQARGHQIVLRFVPSVSEALRRAAEVEYLGGLPTIAVYRRRHRPLSMLLKRALDLGLGCVALVLLSPVLLAIAVAVKLQSDGPVLYASERVGVRGRGFPCYKFRTMVRNADALRSSVAHLNERAGILFKISKDPRVTPLGAWLRRYSLDELPQLFNVLRGEMSLVGPRPSLRAEVLQYEAPHFRRLDVIPGMTGLWQVEARHDPSFESYVALDCRYADEWSIGLDLAILLRTFRAVFLGTGV